MRKVIVLIVPIIFILAAFSICGAEVNYEFVKNQGDAEQKLGPMVRQVCTIIIGVGLGLSIIGIGVGGCQWFGRLFKMDKESGAEKVKAGLMGIVFFGMFWAIVATAFKVVGI